MTMPLTLDRELRAVQNPGLGAMLLWRCCSAYTATNSRGEPVPLPLLFFVLPILLHRETAELVTSTRLDSGLRKCVEKFQLAAQNKTDLLLAIGPRARAMRELTSQSLGIAILSRLVAIDDPKGTVFSLSDTPAVAGIPASVRRLLGGAEKLGSWFGQLSLYEITVLLQVTI